MAGEFIPVKARRGRVVHLTTTGSALAEVTLCGKPCEGFAVAQHATCKTCLRRAS